MRKSVINISAISLGALLLYALADLALLEPRLSVLAKPLAKANTSSRTATKSSSPNADSDSTKASKKIWVRTSPHHCNLRVFMHDQDGMTNFTFGSAEDVDLVATAGTVISLDDGNLTLVSGSIYLICRKGIATIHTTASNATIKVNEWNSVLVESNAAKGTLLVAAFENHPRFKSEVVTLSRKGQEICSLAGGQGISVSSNLSSTKTFDFDTHKPFFDSDSILLVPEADKTAVDATGAPVLVLADEYAKLRCAGPAAIVLESGQIFVDVPEKLAVKTALGNVLISKGGMVDVDTDSEQLRIKSFNASGKVAILCGPQKIDLRSGQELLVCARDIQPGDTTPSDGVGRRRLEKVPMQDTKLKAVVADFSILAYLDQSSHVDSILHAHNDEDKVLHDKILKAASAVQLVTSGYGPYSAVKKIPRKRPPPMRILQPSK